MLTQRRMPKVRRREADEVRRTVAGPGFALADTPPFFKGESFPGLTKLRATLSRGGADWLRFPQLAGYAAWLEELLTAALPEERLSLVMMEFRREPAGYTDKSVDRLHADGSYLRTVYTLYGAPTIYRDGAAERPVPRRQTLLMTAMGRAKALRVPCTLHRRPGAGPERAVIVCAFEPRLA